MSWLMCFLPHEWPGFKTHEVRFTWKKNFYITFFSRIRHWMREYRESFNCKIGFACDILALYFICLRYTWTTCNNKFELCLLEPEQEVIFVDEAGCPEERVAEALKCLSEYDPAGCWEDDLAKSFRYWKIRDFAYAYRAKLVTPSMVWYLTYNHFILEPFTFILLHDIQSTINKCRLLRE